MLERLAAHFLNTYLGNYLENLNTDQLSVALLQGEISLDNVPLRRDALRFINSAIEVKVGFVKSIRLKIPVTRIRSEPWMISMDGVYLVTGPRRFEDFDPDLESSLQQELKLMALDVIENEFRAQRDTDHNKASYSSSYSAWMDYGTSFVGNIIEQLQISIGSVHIRYEDEVVKLSCGIQIGSLLAGSREANETPNEDSKDQRQSLSLKLVQLEHMAVYLNHQETEFYVDMDKRELEKRMGQNESNCSYLVPPVSASAHVIRNCSDRPLNSKKTPRCTCDLHLDHITLNLSKTQYQSFVRGARRLHVLHKNRCYWSYRPSVTVLDSPKAWWLFAFRCVLKPIKERNDALRESTLIAKASENVAYVKAFELYLLNPITLEPELKSLKDQVDAKRNYEELKALRMAALERINARENKAACNTALPRDCDGGNVSYDDIVKDDDDEDDDDFKSLDGSDNEATLDDELSRVVDVEAGNKKTEVPSTTSYLFNYIPGYSWWAAPTAANENEVKDSSLVKKPQEMEEELTSLEEELIEALASDIGHKVTYKDVVFAQVNFVLNSASLSLFTSTDESLEQNGSECHLSELLFEHLVVQMETRPRTQSYKLALQVGGIRMQDKMTQNALFPILLSHQANSCTKNASVGSGKDVSSSLASVIDGFNSFVTNNDLGVKKKGLTTTELLEPVFVFLYEIRPFDSSSDLLLHLHSKPLTTVYNPSMLERILDVFAIPHDLDRTAHLAEKIKSAAYQRIEEATEKTREQFFDNVNATIDLNVHFQTPVLVIPRHERSFDVLIAHLGATSIGNQVINPQDPTNNEYHDNKTASEKGRSDRFVVDVNDMSLHSLNLMERFEEFGDDNLDVLGQLKDIQSQVLYQTSSKAAFPILHDTSLKVVIDRTGHGQLVEGHSSAYNFDISITDDLKLTLFRRQYELLLDCVRNTSKTTSAPPNNTSPNTRQNSNVAEFTDKNYKNKTMNEPALVPRKVRGCFQIHRLALELFDDLDNEEKTTEGYEMKTKKPIVGLEGLEFSVVYTNKTPSEDGKKELEGHCLEISLQSLFMQDLTEGSRNDYLLSSEPLDVSSDSDGPTGGRGRRTRLTPHQSFSCPNLNKATAVGSLSNSRSLPGNLSNCLLFALPKDKKNKGRRCLNRATMSPSTPPPSHVGSNDNLEEPFTTDSLIRVKILDSSKSQVNNVLGKRRSVNVDFNRLDIVFELDTWVVVLDFFGIGSSSSSNTHNLQHQHQKNFGNRRVNDQDKRTKSDECNADEDTTEVSIRVQALTVKLVRLHYNLAEANVRNFAANLSLFRNHFILKGSLGSFLLNDLTPKGSRLYREKFLSKTTFTQGKLDRKPELLRFTFFKYSSNDELLKREYDASLQLWMTSVVYVHTQRFYADLVAFLVQFQQILGARDIVRAEGSKLSDSLRQMALSRGSRVQLKVEVGAPLIVLPLSSTSSNLLAVDIGSLKISNDFRLSGESGNRVVRTSGDLLSANMSVRESRLASSKASIRSRSTARSRGSRLRSNRKTSGLGTTGSGIGSRESCDSGSIETSSSHLGYENTRQALLDVLQVSLNNVTLKTGSRISVFVDAHLENDIHVGAFMLRLDSRKALLQDPTSLKLELRRNLDVAFNNTIPNLSIKAVLEKIHMRMDVMQYVLVNGVLRFNLGDTMEDVDIRMPAEWLINEEDDTRNVTDASLKVNTLLFMDLELSNVVLDLLEGDESNGLARISLISSRLVFESFSDDSQDVDLVSKAIRLEDLRYQHLPQNKRSNVFDVLLQPMNRSDHSEKALQAEVHYRATKDTNQFTILVNAMRVTCIVDWWMAVVDFITHMAEDDENYSKKKDGSGVTEKDSTQKEGIQPILNTLYIEDEPLLRSSGVLTRRTPLLSTGGPLFELKLNVTDSELILVADPTSKSSPIVILKSTTVVGFRPHMTERPFSCNLNNAEVFSCVLDNESESALSIIDPVTINFEISARGQQMAASAGLMDFFSEPMGTDRSVEIQMQHLNIRLSYHDCFVFMSILENLPQQVKEALQQASLHEELEIHEREDKDVLGLMEMGFEKDDCMKALDRCNNDVDAAALWLSNNATVSEANSDSKNQYLEEDITSEMKRVQQSYLQDSSISFSVVEVRTASINFCVIDDCKDADVPLIETVFNHLHLRHSFQGEGDASSHVRGSYYNRSLSAWEPFMEPWKATMDWRLFKVGKDGQKLSLNISTVDVLNLNLTSAMLTLYKTVTNNWSEDLRRLEKQGGGISSRDYFKITSRRQRTPFVAYALCNLTGHALHFYQIGGHLAPIPYLVGDDTSQHQTNPMTRQVARQVTQWQLVEAGQCVNLSFEDKGKLRHSHAMAVHQIVARVSGYRELTPVKVSRVGTYVKEAVSSSVTDVKGHRRYARIVFDVRLEGSAKKLITVRSALTVRNKIHGVTMKLRMEDFGALEARMEEVLVPPGSEIPVPLHLVWSSLYARPEMLETETHFSPTAINWSQVTDERNNVFTVHTCALKEEDVKSQNNTKRRRDNSEKPSLKNHRFCSSIRILPFPHGSDPSSLTQQQYRMQPQHVITLVAPVVLVNLLPVNLGYCAGNEGGSSKSDVNDVVKPGKQVNLKVDVSKAMWLSLSLEHYRCSSNIFLNANPSDFDLRLRLMDNQNRPLQLIVRGRVRLGGAVKIKVLAPIWIVNKTGLPLIFKQEGEKTDASGQDEEHEVARMSSPLMFAFVERDNAENHSNDNALCVRIGKGLHNNGFVSWCKHFFVQAGSQVRKLVVRPHDERRVQWVYMIGIEIRSGRNRYSDTAMVTLVPRFHLYNESSHRIQFGQRCYASSFNDPEASATLLQAMPKSNLAFHWPRIDLDQLLCIKLLDIKDCEWSGGFVIESMNSFQVCVRDVNAKAHFVHVEVNMVGATYCVIITDAHKWPPPFRVDNMAEVAVIINQTGVEEAFMKSTVRPHTSLPFAWDEPTLEPFVTCAAPGGSEAVYNMDVIGEGARLSYENFVYIVMNGSVTDLNGDSGETRASEDKKDMEVMEQKAPLVFEVTDGHRVCLSYREPGKRSQLWQLTSRGLLVHEGSAPPRDPLSTSTKSNTSKSKSSPMVLDIASVSPEPHAYVPLVVRRADERRRLTQTWRFTRCGRLVCGHNRLYVQAKDGFGKLAHGIEVVLGPSSPVCLQSMPNGTPLEQAIGRQKLRPGSGLLDVRVTTDGPTRVLQVSDAKLKDHSHPLGTYASLPRRGRELQLVLQAKAGVGLSVVSVDEKASEELLYLHLSNVVLDYQRSYWQHIFDVSAQGVQMDNQLIDCVCPVVLHLSPSSRSDDYRHMPAIHLTANKCVQQRDGPKKAEIFKHLMLTVKNISLTLEEELLCKLIKFAGAAFWETEEDKFGDESAFEMQRSALLATTSATRLYFGHLKLTLNQVRLSVIQSAKMEAELRAVRRRAGLRLITFEDANVELKPFIGVHLFETLNFLTNTVYKHYHDELLSQAVRILGSTDFLGNPIGFLNDVSEGVSGLVAEGNVGGLIKNVAHGAANSAAKVTGTLSQGLSKVTLEERYGERRLRLQHNSRGLRSKEHLISGMKGLGFGVVGGLTSIVTETYDGVANQGVTGLFTGLGWGIVGTISKPAIGVLDMATGAANAVKESSRGSRRQLPNRLRVPRVVVGAGGNGNLPVFDERHAIGQQRLLLLNGGDRMELYVGYEQLRSGDEDLQIIVSNERVLVFSQQGGSNGGQTSATSLTSSSSTSLSPLSPSTKFKKFLAIALDELTAVRHVVRRDPFDNKTQICLEFLVDSLDSHEVQRPNVIVDTSKVAEQAEQIVLYAKAIHDERQCRYIGIEASIEDDDDDYLSQK